MSALTAWVHMPAAQAVGWALIHFLWEGAALAALLAAVLFTVRPRSARARYAAACIALFAMPVAFCITLAVLLGGISTSSVTVMHFPGAAPHLLAAPSLPPSPPAGFSFRDLFPWLVPCWFLGVAVFYARGLAGWFAVSRLRRRGICVPPAEWVDRLAPLCRRLSLSRPVRLLESCFTNTPVLVGYLRPVIFVPLGCLANLSAAQIECVLIHELAHVRRHDYLVNLLQGFVEGLLFYHPAVWWASRVVREERENCCDDLVVETTGDARLYAVTLTALEQQRALSMEVAIAATGGSLMKRIRRLLADPGPARHSAAPPIAAGLLLVAFAVAVTAWPATSSAAPRVPAVALQARLLEAQLLEPRMSRLTESLQTDPGQTPPGQTVETQAGTDAKRQAEEDALRSQIGTPYQKWLTEDVVYIITADERSAFLRLRNNEEREQFIEQFWNRRDPTPGTQENKFKEEHYRRIAYANEHFGTAAPAGWRTDRGRTYIIYGPADEIEDHPAGGQNVAPYQRWTYHLIDGIGEHVTFVFSDRDRNGQFRLVEERAGERQANANSNTAQLKALQGQLMAANERLGQLRQQYQDANPEVQAARERLAQLKAEVAAVEIVASEKAQKDLSQAKEAQARQAQALAQAQAQTGAAELARNRAAVEADLQAAIGAAKERLANLQQTYTEKYPEVRAQQQNLKRLEEQVAFLNENGAKALVKAPAPSVTAAKIFRSDQDPRVQVATGAQSASGSVIGLSALIVALSPDKHTSSVTAEITNAAGQKVQTVAVAEQVQAPGPFFRWVVLPPGSYVLKATIEGPKGVSKSSQTRFTVE